MKRDTNNSNINEKKDKRNEVFVGRAVLIHTETISRNDSTLWRKGRASQTWPWAFWQRYQSGGDLWRKTMSCSPLVAVRQRESLREKEKSI